MKYTRLLLFILPLLLQSFDLKKVSFKGDDSKKWVSLFNGKNLDNWTVKIAGYKTGENFGNTFRVENGILSTRYNAYDSFNNRFGALYFNKKFTNYRLKVEYRFVGNLTPGAPAWGFKDGGIQYHCQSPSTVDIDQSFPVCLEYNLHGGDGKGERPTGEICTSGMFVEIDGKKNSSNCTTPLVKRTFNGEEWITAEVEVRDGKIIHFVNGEEIMRFEHPTYDSTNAFAKNLMAAGNNVVKDGYISIQSNSHPMDFRKIEILEY